MTWFWQPFSTAIPPSPRSEALRRRGRGAGRAWHWVAESVAVVVEEVVSSTGRIPRGRLLAGRLPAVPRAWNWSLVDEEPPLYSLFRVPVGVRGRGGRAWDWVPAAADFVPEDLSPSLFRFPNRGVPGGWTFSLAYTDVGEEVVGGFASSARGRPGPVRRGAAYFHVDLATAEFVDVRPVVSSAIWPRRELRRAVPVSFFALGTDIEDDPTAPAASFVRGVGREWKGVGWHWFDNVFVSLPAPPLPPPDPVGPPPGPLPASKDPSDWAFEKSVGKVWDFEGEAT